MIKQDKEETFFSEKITRFIYKNKIELFVFFCWKWSLKGRCFEFFLQCLDSVFVLFLERVEHLRAQAIEVVFGARVFRIAVEHYLGFQF